MAATRPKTRTIPPKSKLATLIDELGALQEDLLQAGAPAKIRRAEALRKELAAEIDGLAPADRVWHGCGEHFEVLAGMKENRRRVRSVSEVQAALGPERFLDACSVTLAALERVLPASEAAGLVVEERTGPRSIQSFRRAETARKAKAAA
jgi:hypothetical protein